MLLSKRIIIWVTILTVLSSSLPLPTVSSLSGHYPFCITVFTVIIHSDIVAVIIHSDIIFAVIVYSDITFAVTVIIHPDVIFAVIIHPASLSCHYPLCNHCLYCHCPLCHHYPQCFYLHCHYPQLSQSPTITVRPVVAIQPRVCCPPTCARCRYWLTDRCSTSATISSFSISACSITWSFLRSRSTPHQQQPHPQQGQGPVLMTANKETKRQRWSQQGPGRCPLPPDCFTHTHTHTQIHMVAASVRLAWGRPYLSAHFFLLKWNEMKANTAASSCNWLEGNQRNERKEKRKLSRSRRCCWESRHYGLGGVVGRRKVGGGGGRWLAWSDCDNWGLCRRKRLVERWTGDGLKEEINPESRYQLWQSDPTVTIKVCVYVVGGKGRLGMG